jgi:hypothetical protein
MAKYRIINNNLYNFDKTSFIIDIITILIVIIYIDKRRKAKSI